MDPVTPSTMSTIIGYIGDLVEATADWIGNTVGIFTTSGNELLLFSALVGFVGIGIGLCKRIFRIKA